MKTLFSFFVLSTVFTAVSSAQTAANSLRVEVKIFSGRQNPVFTVTDPAEIREIMSLAASFPRKTALSAAESEGPPILGYQGIEITNSSTIALDVQALAVRHSAVQLSKKNPSQARGSATGASIADAIVLEARLDGTTTLENRLLQIARNKNVIDDATVKAIREEK